MASDFMVADAQGLHAPLLSILVPIYNVAPWLEECVESILSQGGGEDVEIILLDDASTDESGTLAAALADRHPGRITFMAHEVNQGLSAARNSMLARARGHHVWFVDSDDMLLPGALPMLLEILQRHDPDVVICDYNKNGKRDLSAFTGRPRILMRDRDALLHGVFESRRLHAWLKIWRRSLWTDDIRFPVGRVFEDVATTPFLLLRAQSHYYVPERWIFYRVRPGSILTSVRGGRFDARKHDDYVHALTGLKEALATDLPGMSAETAFIISHFIAREFASIGQRLIRTSMKQRDLRPIAPVLRRYRVALDQRSPIPFDELARLYLRRGRLIRWAVLRFFLFRARAPRLRP
jgi:glycosyltransferase involved in cell wall biosynthesis